MKTLIRLALLSAVVLIAQNSKSTTGFWAPPPSAYENYRTGLGCNKPGSDCWNWNTAVTDRNNKVTAEYRKRVPLKEWLSSPVR